MALVKKSVQKSLEDFLLSLQDNPSDDTKKKVKKYASGFSDWVIETIKASTITVNAGIPVATAGSPASQTGATTSPGTTTIS